MGRFPSPMARIESKFHYPVVGEQEEVAEPLEGRSRRSTVGEEEGEEQELSFARAAAQRPQQAAPPLPRSASAPQVGGAGGAGAGGAGAGGAGAGGASAGGAGGGIGLGYGVWQGEDHGWPAGGPSLGAASQVERYLSHTSPPPVDQLPKVVRQSRCLRHCWFQLVSKKRFRHGRLEGAAGSIG